MKHDAIMDMKRKREKCVPVNERMYGLMEEEGAMKSYFLNE